MQALSASELLGVWERGLNQPPVQQALLLLTAACPEASGREIAEWSVGQRDSLLLTLREWLFGSQLHSLVTCPHCDDRLELSFTTADIRAVAVPAPTMPLQTSIANYAVQFRLPNSLDLVACMTETANRSASPQHLLLERCLLSAAHQGEEQSIEQLPPDVIEAVTAQMAQADPQADVQLNLVCPACENGWRSPFDIVSFLWREIHVWAVRMLREVHVLASAYGWREADILAMNPYRRQLYLEMIGR